MSELDKSMLPTTLSTITMGSSLHANTIDQIANTGGGYRACAIEIRNYHRDLELVEPSYYLWSGMCAIPPSPAIKPGHAEACLFHSTPGILYGTWGVLTYGIDHVTVNVEKSEIMKRRSEGFRFALTWGVPMSGYTKHAVGISVGATASEELYNMMSEGTGPWFTRELQDNCIKYDTTVYNIPITVQASISNVNRAVWIVNIQ